MEGDLPKRDAPNCGDDLSPTCGAIAGRSRFETAADYLEQVKQTIANDPSGSKWHLIVDCLNGTFPINPLKNRTNLGIARGQPQKAAKKSPENGQTLAKSGEILKVEPSSNPHSLVILRPQIRRLDLICARTVINGE